MRYRAYSFLLLLTCIQPVFAQKIGEPQAVKLLGTSTPLTLEFSDRDYMLIVYSLNADEPPDLKDNPEYSFAVFSVSSALIPRPFAIQAQVWRHIRAVVWKSSFEGRNRTWPGVFNKPAAIAPWRRRSRRIRSAPAGSFFRHSVTCPIRP